MQCFCWLSDVTDVLVGLDREGSAPPCVPYVLSACWQWGHGPFWPLALAPLRWLTSFLHNWVKAQIIPAYSAALPVSSSTYTKQKWTHRRSFRYIFMFTNLETMPYNQFFYVVNIWDRAYIYTAYLTCQLSYVQILRVFLINQLYQSCAMHHKSLIALMLAILLDLSHLSPSVAIVCVCAQRAQCLVLSWLLWKLYWIPPSPKGKRFKCLCNYTSNNSAVHLGQANDKELQVSQSIEGLLISVTCLSSWVGNNRGVSWPMYASRHRWWTQSISLYQRGWRICLRTEGNNFTRSHGTCFRLKPSDSEMRRDGRECRRLLVATVCNLLWPYTLTGVTSFLNIAPILLKRAWSSYSLYNMQIMMDIHFLQWFQQIKIIILSLFTQYNVIPNLYDCISSVQHKMRILTFWNTKLQMTCEGTFLHQDGMKKKMYSVF